MPAEAQFEAARRILRDLRAAGHEAYLAGGCVRDHLLGLEPKDFDVATSARPEEVEGLFRRTIAVGRAFGVICALIDEQQVEIATFRSEADYGDARHPGSVTFTDARTDVLRRDFTVNALLWDPDSGEIVDHVGGRADIERRVVRAVGDPEERFQEDALRLLRAVRFGTLLDFHLDPATATAIRRHANGLSHVSAERVHDELARMAAHPHGHPGSAWRLLVELELAPRILPLQAECVDVDGDCAVLERLERPSLPLFLAVGLRRVLPAGSAPRAWRDLGERAAGALRCSAAERRSLSRLLEFRPRYRDLVHGGRVRQRLAAAQADRDDHERLLAAEQDPGGALAVLRSTRERHGDSLPAPLLTGTDLRAAGIPPGPLLGWKLRRARWLQLAGQLEDAAQALAAVT